MRFDWFRPVPLAAAAIMLSCGSDAGEPAGPVDLEPGAAGMQIFAGNSQEAVVATQLPAPLVVRVIGAEQQPLAGVTVSWEAAEANGTVSVVAPETDAAGLARAWWTLGTGIGEQRVLVRVTGVTGSLWFRAFGLAAAPASLEWVDEGEQPAFVNTTLHPQVQVKDEYGNVAGDVDVGFSAIAGGGWTADSVATTDGDGLAGVDWYMGPDAEVANVLRAQVGTLTAELTALALPAEPGRLVIVGGALSTGNSEVYQAILDARQGEGQLCVIPTASDPPESAMQSAVNTFDSHGGPGTARGVLLSMSYPDDADDPVIAAELLGCSGYFFTGGQQSRVANLFRPGGGSTLAYEAMLERHGQGAVVSGSSAGAAIMSDPMISGGSSTGALAVGVGSGGVSIMTGLGFLEGTGVDQHFLARGRIGRLLVAVLQVDEYEVGFGIDENTALVVEQDSAWVLGASGVVVIEGQDAVRAEEGNGGTGLVLRLMGRDDVYHLPGRLHLIAPAKQSLQPSGEVPAAPADLFDSWVFLHLLEELARSDTTEVVVPVEGYELVFRKAAGFEARSYAGQGVQGSAAGLSIGPLEVEVNRSPAG